ncbi:uncharacterized protein V1513DRAFT_460581 [Lipomyces chichibuensis]|uniref:uncharacterized protein n=1 Tax=Lipomyces chichibuensis TaxID=1546026 RepID=UPI0033436B87
MSSHTSPRISEALKQDRRDIEDCYESVLRADSQDNRERWANQFAWEAVRLLVGEEIVLYPAFEKYLPNGKAVADKDRNEHQMVKNDLYKFEHMEPSDKDFIPILNRIMSELNHHMTSEQEIQLPQIESVISAEESVNLAKRLSRTKHFVPTHSHPSAPNEPPFETAVALLTAPIDKIRDMFMKFPEEPITT